MSNPDQPKVSVMVNGEEYPFTAHYASQDSLFGEPDAFAPIVRLVPDEKPGWRFEETVDGRWYGFRLFD